MDLSKLAGFLEKAGGFLDKVKAGAAIAKPLITEVKTELQPVIDDIKEHGLFKRKKRIIALENQDQKTLAALAIQTSLNESQQKQIEDLESAVRELKEAIDSLIVS